MIIKLLILSTFIFRFSICDYCSHPDCSLPNQHTMCAANNKKSTRLFVSGLTPWMRYEILLLHNKHRDNIAMGLEAGQPKAANMRKIYWDYELEDIADTWARQCQNKHDECRNTIRFNVVQNMDIRPIGPQVTEAQLLSDAVGSWFSGSRALSSDQVFSFKLNNCSAPGGCNSHWYAAATWASTWRIGCSQALCTMEGKHNFGEIIHERDKRTLNQGPLRVNITHRRTTENVLRRTRYFSMHKEKKFPDYITTISNEDRKTLLYRGSINAAEKLDGFEDTQIIAYTFCNYGPAGNTEGFPIYEVGNTCSNCPQGTQCTDQTYRGLCAVIGDTAT